MLRENAIFADSTCMCFIGTFWGDLQNTLFPISSRNFFGLVAFPAAVSGFCSIVTPAVDTLLHDKRH